MSEALKEFWKFDDADLAANRNGQLSEKQRTFLVGEHKSQKNVYLGVGGVLLLLFLGIPALVLSRILPAGGSSLTDSLTSGSGVIRIIPIIVILIVVVIIYAVRAGKQADIVVKRAAGKTTYSWGTKRVRNPGNSARPYDDVRVLHLSLGEKKFEVHNDLQEIIRESEEWMIYYTSSPFRFLSGEVARK
ncbi:MAG: hypothetical protein QM730_08355 [Anaerolineales bacterium]